MSEAEIAKLTSRLEELKERIEDPSIQKIVVGNEATTITSLINPFFRALGYDTENPTEYLRELDSGFGGKKDQKLDIGIKINDELAILIECKPFGEELGAHKEQLERYFAAHKGTKNKVAILTDGRWYKFFSDTKKDPNVMHNKPYFEFDVSSFEPDDVAKLYEFSKAQIHQTRSNLREKAELGKWRREIAAALDTEFKNPSRELIKTLFFKGRLTDKLFETLQIEVKKAIRKFIDTEVTARYTRAIDKSEDESTEEIEEVSNEPSEDETNAFLAIKIIAGKIGAADRVFCRNNQRYLAVILDDNNRKKVARLYFNSATNKQIGLFNKSDEEKHKIKGYLDIGKFDEQILAAIKKHL